MRFLAILLIVLTRLLVVLPLLLLRWAVDFIWGMLFALAKTLLYLARLLLGTALRPLSHRFVLIAVAIVIVVAAASDPRMQNPSFYGIFVGTLVVCFFSGRLGRLLLPRTAPEFTGMFPALPGWPSWPPIPEARPRPAKAAAAPAVPRSSPAPVAAPTPPMPSRPAASPVFVVASSAALPAASEQEAVTALPDELQRLMRPKNIPVSGAPVPPPTSERAAPG